MSTEAVALSKLSEGTLTVKICGEIDHHSAKEVRESIDAALLLHRPKRLVLRLEEMRFMDSAGLGLILGRVAGAKEIGAAVEIAGADARALRIMEMAGLFRRTDLKIHK